MKQKINLLEMSFLIPVRIDSVVRLEEFTKVHRVHSSKF